MSMRKTNTLFWGLYVHDFFFTLDFWSYWKWCVHSQLFGIRFRSSTNTVDSIYCLFYRPCVLRNGNIQKRVVFHFKTAVHRS